jgi:hypothetical protein
MTVFCVLAGVLFCGGCGVVSVMGTQSQYEKKVPAEYDLAAQKDKKILVLAEQPSWLSTEVNLRYYLTEGVRENLIAKAKIPSEYIISYKEFSEFRSNKSDFSLLSPVEVGQALGADFVLLIVIEDFQLGEMPDTGYYNGFLGVQAVLFETATGAKLWPESAVGKNIKVGFEAEKDRDASVNRLVNSCAYCTARYFYDCPKYKFKIFDEVNKVGWDG